MSGSRAKRSVLRELVLGRGYEQSISGWEGGELPAAPLFTGWISPLACEFFPAGNDPSLRRVGAPLLEEAAEAATGAGIDPAKIEIRLVTAELQESRGETTEPRSLCYSALTLGGGAGHSIHTRVAPISPDQPAWPENFLASFFTVSGPSDGDLPKGHPLRQPIWLEPFAAADMLRLAASAWLARGQAGEQVASSVTTISDPGWWGPNPSAPDADGVPARSIRVVEGGRIKQLPQRDPSSGSWLFNSWREPPRLGFRSLVWDGPAVAQTGTGVRIARLIPLRTGVLVAGFKESEGRRLRFGPIPGPPPDWWLRRVIGADGPPVSDATGFPVSVPKLLIGI